MKIALSLIAVAGIAAGANAAVSQLTWNVSVNGGAYSTAAVANPGDTLTFRLRVSLTGNTGPGSVAGSFGLAGFNFLPTLAGWGGGDTATPLGVEQFPEGTANNPFPGVINHPDLGTITNVYQGVPATFRGPGNIALNGRNAPWGANGTNNSGPGGGIALPVVAGNVLQWKAAVIGTGVSLAQLNVNTSGISGITGVDDAGTPGDTSDDSTIFNSSIGNFANNSKANLTVFTYSVVLGADSALRDLIQSSSLLSPVQWFTSATGNSSSVPVPATTNAVVAVTPAPGALALLGLGGLVAGRRRRN